MRVVVFDIMNDPIGIGELIRYEEVSVTDEEGSVLCKMNTPVIVMEDGEIFAGFECWWIGYEDFVTINQMMLYKQVVVL